jgi:hypothetical protein
MAIVTRPASLPPELAVAVLETTAATLTPAERRRPEYALLCVLWDGRDNALAALHSARLAGASNATLKAADRRYERAQAALLDERWRVGR